MEKTANKKLALLLGILCILLSTILLGAITSYNSTVNNLNLEITEKNQTISSLNSQISNQTNQINQLSKKNDQLQTWLNGNVTVLNSQLGELQDKFNSLSSQTETLQNQTKSDKANIASLQDQVAFGKDTINSLNSTISILQNQAATDRAAITSLQFQLDNENIEIKTLNSTIADLQNQVENLTAIINASRSQPQTLVFHVSEKGDGYEWGRIPNVNSTYNQILALNNNTYNVLLLPEYKGNENWTETLAWLKENFKGIPIMLTVFEGGPYDYPVQKLTTGQISQAMASLDVRGIRIFEVISWYIEHNSTFPTNYVTNLLTFCRTNNLTVFWSEWKVGDDVLQRIQNYTAGFQDSVIVSFSTNSGDLEPADGFMLVGKMFPRWGASVQAWYWETRHRGNYTIVPENPLGDSNPLNMPISLMIDHALLAKYMGAEVIQFEPYWYFFDNGQANGKLVLLEAALNTKL